MPRLLQNIHEIIEAFGRYAGSEGGCAALSRGELKRLLEQEFASVIVKPHDPATVDEVLRLLDEDKTGTVEFKEFLVLVFKVAQACFKTLSEAPGGACRYQESESHHAGSSAELGQGQRSGTEGRQPQSSQASGGQGRTGTRIPGQDSSSAQVSSHGRQASSQRQQTVRQQTQATGQAEQTPRADGKRHRQTRERSSERWSQSSQQTGELVTRATTRVHTGASQKVEQGQIPQSGSTSIQTQWSTHDQNRRPESHGQDWSQDHQVMTGHNQAQAGSYTQTHSQAVEQGQIPQSGSASIQTQWSTHDQNRGPESHSQDWSQDHQVVTGHNQAQAGSYTQTHSQAVEQGQIPQSGSASIQTPWSTCGQNRGTENNSPDRSQAQQVVTGGPIQTQAGSSTQTVPWRQTESQAGAQEQRQTQTQPNRGHGWIPVSTHEAVEPAPGGQAQAGASPVTERREVDSSHPGGQGERVPTVVSEEWVDDHTREVVIRSEDSGRLRSGAPSA
uniref:cornulin n=1 Tax=Jaculus jaculus TaxID=51337 RepID=UPI001E1B56EA|nr:cornulin [Jaculus jaculus]